MNHVKNIFVAACFAIATSALNGAVPATSTKLQPNFELFNKLPNSVYITLNNVETSSAGSSTSATEVKSGKGNQFQTRVKRNRPTLIKFWDKAGTITPGNTQIGEYKIEGVAEVPGKTYNPSNIYVTIGYKSGKVELYRQTGPVWGAKGVTESGLTLKNLVPKEDITKVTPYEEISAEFE